MTEYHFYPKKRLQELACSHFYFIYLFFQKKKERKRENSTWNAECVRLQRWHLTKHSPSSNNVKLQAHSTANYASPWVLCGFARQVQALGFILSEVKWKKFTYSCCSTLKSITLQVKFAAFASGERWGGSIHAWLLSPSKVGDETSQNCVTVLSGMIFFFFFFFPSNQVLVGCDFNMAGGLEGMLQTLTVDATGNQKNSCKLEIKHRRNIHI